MSNSHGGTNVDALKVDKLEIAEVVQNWAVWRDAGDWERFRSVWHEDGWMSATWLQGPAERIGNSNHLFLQAQRYQRTEKRSICAEFCEKSPLMRVGRSLRRPVGADFDAP